MTRQADLIPDEFTLLLPLDDGSVSGVRDTDIDMPITAGFSWWLSDTGVPTLQYDKALDTALGLQGELRAATASMRDLQHEALTARQDAQEATSTAQALRIDLDAELARTRSLTASVDELRADLKIAQSQQGGWDEIGTGAGGTLLATLAVVLAKDRLGKKESQ